MKIIVQSVAIIALLAQMAYAEQCDYKVDLVLNGTSFTSEEFSWKLTAVNVNGQPSPTSTIATIKNSDGTVKSYSPWTNITISRQKTSNKYSPNLKPGQYTLEAEILGQCEDINIMDNKDTGDFTILGLQEQTEDNLKSEDNQEDLQTGIQDTTETNASNNRETPKIEQYNNIIQLKTKEIQGEDLNSNGYISSSQKSGKLILPLLIIASITIAVALLRKR